MENLLQGIPQVNVWMDDILISGKDYNNHVANLEAVLQKLSEAGLWLWKEKSFFMVSEVTYCGYVINDHGIKPVEANSHTECPSAWECYTAACISGNAQLLWLFPTRHRYSTRNHSTSFLDKVQSGIGRPSKTWLFTNPRN